MRNKVRSLSRSQKVRKETPTAHKQKQDPLHSKILSYDYHSYHLRAIGNPDIQRLLNLDYTETILETSLPDFLIQKDSSGCSPFEEIDESVLYEHDEEKSDLDESDEENSGLKESNLDESEQSKSDHEEEKQDEDRDEGSEGQPLPEALRTYFEKRFGVDFKDVRVHNDSEAAYKASQTQAQALTLNNNIYFGQDQYSPNTRRGRKLIAHELAHVVQGRLHRKKASQETHRVSQPDEPAEKEAETIARSVVYQDPAIPKVTVPASPTVIHRKAPRRDDEEEIEGLGTFTVTPKPPEGIEITRFSFELPERLSSFLNVREAAAQLLITPYHLIVFVQLPNQTRGLTAQINLDKIKKFLNELAQPYVKAFEDALKKAESEAEKVFELKDTYLKIWLNKHRKEYLVLDLKAVVFHLSRDSLEGFRPVEAHLAFGKSADLFLYYSEKSKQEALQGLGKPLNDEALKLPVPELRKALFGSGTSDLWVWIYYNNGVFAIGVEADKSGKQGALVKADIKVIVDSIVSKLSSLGRSAMQVAEAIKEKLNRLDFNIQVPDFPSLPGFNGFIFDFKDFTIGFDLSIQLPKLKKGNFDLKSLIPDFFDFTFHGMQLFALPEFPATWSRIRVIKKFKFPKALYEKLFNSLKELAPGLPQLEGLGLSKLRIEFVFLRPEDWLFGLVIRLPNRKIGISLPFRKVVDAISRLNKELSGKVEAFLNKVIEITEILKGRIQKQIVIDENGILRIYLDEKRKNWISFDLKLLFDKGLKFENLKLVDFNLISDLAAAQFGIMQGEKGQIVSPSGKPLAQAEIDDTSLLEPFLFVPGSKLTLKLFYDNGNVILFGTFNSKPVRVILIRVNVEKLTKELKDTRLGSYVTTVIEAFNENRSTTAEGIKSRFEQLSGSRFKIIINENNNDYVVFDLKDIFTGLLEKSFKGFRPVSFHLTLGDIAQLSLYEKGERKELLKNFEPLNKPVGVSVSASVPEALFGVQDMYKIWFSFYLHKTQTKIAINAAVEKDSRGMLAIIDLKNLRKKILEIFPKFSTEQIGKIEAFFDRLKGQVSEVKSEIEKLFSIENDRILRLYLDKNQNNWIGFDFKLLFDKGFSPEGLRPVDLKLESDLAAVQFGVKTDKEKIEIPAGEPIAEVDIDDISLLKRFLLLRGDKLNVRLFYDNDEFILIGIVNSQPDQQRLRISVNVDEFKKELKHTRLGKYEVENIKSRLEPLSDISRFKIIINENNNDYAVFDLKAIFTGLLKGSFEGFRPVEVRLTLGGIVELILYGEETKKADFLRGFGAPINDEPVDVPAPSFREALFGPDQEKSVWLYVYFNDEEQKLAISAAVDKEDTRGALAVINLDVLKSKLEKVLREFRRMAQRFGKSIAAKMPKFTRRNLNVFGSLLTFNFGQGFSIGFNLRVQLPNLSADFDLSRLIPDSFDIRLAGLRFFMLPDVTMPWPEVEFPQIKLIKSFSLKLGKGKFKETLKNIISYLKALSPDIPELPKMLELPDISIPNIKLMLVDPKNWHLGLTIDIGKFLSNIPNIDKLLPNWEMYMGRKLGFDLPIGRYLQALTGAAGKIAAKLNALLSNSLKRLKGENLGNLIKKHIDINEEGLLRIYLDKEPSKTGNRVGFDLKELFVEGFDPRTDFRPVELYLKSPFASIEFGTLKLEQETSETPITSVIVKKPEGTPLYEEKDIESDLFSKFFNVGTNKLTAALYFRDKFFLIYITFKDSDLGILVTLNTEQLSKILQKIFPKARLARARKILDKQKLANQIKKKKGIVIRFGTSKRDESSRQVSGYAVWKLKSLLQRSLDFSFSSMYPDEFRIDVKGTFRLQFGQTYSAANLKGPVPIPVDSGLKKKFNIDNTITHLDFYFNNTKRAVDIILAEPSQNQQQVKGLFLRIYKASLETLKKGVSSKLSIKIRKQRRKKSREGTLNIKADKEGIWIGFGELDKDDISKTKGDYVLFKYGTIIPVITGEKELSDIAPDAFRVSLFKKDVTIEGEEKVVEALPKGKLKNKKVGELPKDLQKPFIDLGFTKEHIVFIDAEQSTFKSEGKEKSPVVNLSGGLYLKTETGYDAVIIKLDIKLERLLETFLPKKPSRKRRRRRRRKKRAKSKTGVSLRLLEQVKAGQNGGEQWDTIGVALKIMRKKNKTFTLKAEWKLDQLIEVLLNLDKIIEHPQMLLPVALSGRFDTDNFGIEFERRTDKIPTQGYELDLGKMVGLEELHDLFSEFLNEELIKNSKLFLDFDLDNLEKIKKSIKDAIKEWKGFSFASAALVISGGKGSSPVAYSIKLYAEPKILLRFLELIPEVGPILKIARLAYQLLKDPEATMDEAFYTTMAAIEMLRARPYLKGFKNVTAKDMALLMMLGDPDMQEAYWGFRTIRRLGEAGLLSKEILDKYPKDEKSEPADFDELIHNVKNLSDRQLKKTARLHKHEFLGHPKTLRKLYDWYNKQLPPVLKQALRRIESAAERNKKDLLNEIDYRGFDSDKFTSKSYSQILWAAERLEAGLRTHEVIEQFITGKVKQPGQGTVKKVFSTILQNISDLEAAKEDVPGGEGEGKEPGKEETGQEKCESKKTRIRKTLDKPPDKELSELANKGTIKKDGCVITLSEKEKEHAKEILDERGIGEEEKVSGLGIRLPKFWLKLISYNSETKMLELIPEAKDDSFWENRFVSDTEQMPIFKDIEIHQHKGLTSGRNRRTFIKYHFTFTIIFVNISSNTNVKPYTRTINTKSYFYFPDIEGIKAGSIKVYDYSRIFNRVVDFDNDKLRREPVEIEIPKPHFKARLTDYMTVEVKKVQDNTYKIFKVTLTPIDLFGAKVFLRDVLNKKRIILLEENKPVEIHFLAKVLTKDKT